MPVFDHFPYTRPGQRLVFVNELSLRNPYVEKNDHQKPFTAPPGLGEYRHVLDMASIFIGLQNHVDYVHLRESRIREKLMPIQKVGSTCVELLRLSEWVQELSEKTAIPESLNLTQLRVLLILSERRSSPDNKWLAKKVGLTESGISRLLKSLESRKLVWRRRNPRSRDSSAGLTTIGKELLGKVITSIEDEVEQSAALLPTEVRVSLPGNFAALREALPRERKRKSDAEWDPLWYHLHPGENDPR